MSFNDDDDLPNNDDPQQGHAMSQPLNDSPSPGSTDSRRNTSLGNNMSLPLLSILHSPSIMRPVDPVSAQPSIVLQTSLD